MIPTNKVTAGVLAGALTGILVWGLKQKNIDMPPDVAVWVSTVISFIVSYITPDKESQ